MRACPHCRSTYVSEIEFCGIDGTQLLDCELDPLIGQTIDRYLITELLGAGAMAAVYRARHTVLGRDFAIKVLFGELAANRTVVARFRREAQALSLVRHTNIISVVDFGTTDRGLTFLIMDYVQGTTLSDVIAQEAPLSPSRAARITRQTASALAEVHRIGLIHRDVKPANLFLVRESGEEVVKLLDFGIVAVEESAESTKLTATGKIVGTPIYMAPEQGAPGPVTQAADLYALGVILYQMLAGHPPFEGTGLAEVLVKHAIEAPPPLVPCGGLERLALHLLEKNPARRPQSAELVIAEIDRLGFGRTSSPPEVRALPSFHPAPAAPGNQAPPSIASLLISEPPPPFDPSRAAAASHPELKAPEGWARMQGETSSPPRASLMSPALSTHHGESDLPIVSHVDPRRWPRIGPITGLAGLFLGALALALAYWSPLDGSPRAGGKTAGALEGRLEIGTLVAAPVERVATTTTSTRAAIAGDDAEDAKQAAASLPRLERKLHRALDRRGLSESDLRSLSETAWLLKRWRAARDEGREADAAVAAAELIDAAKSVAVTQKFLRNKVKRLWNGIRAARLRKDVRAPYDAKLRELASQIKGASTEEAAIKLSAKITRLEEELDRRQK